MRVYEFAKKHGLPSKELVALLSENGFSVSSHMAVLSGPALEFLKNKFEKKATPQLEKKPEKKLDLQPPAASSQEKRVAQKELKPETTKEEKKCQMLSHLNKMQSQLLRIRHHPLMKALCVMLLGKEWALLLLCQPLFL